MTCKIGKKIVRRSGKGSCHLHLIRVHCANLRRFFSVFHRVSSTARSGGNELLIASRTACINSSRELNFLGSIGAMEHQSRRAALYLRSALWHHLFCAQNRDRHNGKSGFRRQMKWPFLERQQSAIA